MGEARGEGEFKRGDYSETSKALWKIEIENLGLEESNFFQHIVFEKTIS